MWQVVNKTQILTLMKGVDFLYSCSPIQMHVPAGTMFIQLATMT